MKRNDRSKSMQRQNINIAMELYYSEEVLSAMRACGSVEKQQGIMRKARLDGIKADEEEAMKARLRQKK